jgi:transcriptional regulator with XRE-family HTH domain
MDIAALAQDIAMKRGTVGVRAAARDAGISPATLSRIENGHVPDLETFEKICQWLGKDPSRFLATPPTGVVAAVQFRKKDTVKKETADALGSLIMAVQAMLEAETGGAGSV